MTKYVEHDRGKEKVDHLSPRIGIINVIISRILTEEYSNSTRKSYASSVGVCSIYKNTRFNHNITFNEEDLIDVTSSHDNAFVVVDDIVNFNIKRIQVESGSVVNVLTLEAILGLKVSPKKLNIINIPYKVLKGQL